MSYWPLFRDYISDLYHEMPLWVYVAALCIVVAGGVTLIAVKGWKKGTTAIARLFLLVYVAWLLCATLVFRTTKAFPDFRTIPLWHYAEEILSPDAIVNVLVFIPLGFVLCPSFRKMKWWQAPIFGFALSVFIELLQLLFRRGCSDVDDVIHNTLGCLLGCGIYWATAALCRKCAPKSAK